MGIDNLKFYYPLPKFGKSFSRQLPEMREDFNNLATLIRAAQVDVNETSGEHDLSRWMLGEKDFRNRFGLFYDKDADEFKIQLNTGTESSPVWTDCLQIRQTDCRVIAAGDGGFQSLQGFYTPHLPALRIRETEDGGHNQIHATMFVDSTYFYLQGKSGAALLSFDETNLTSSGEANTASNLGGDEGIFASKSGVDLRFKGLSAGSNITLSSDASSVTIASTASGGGGFYGILLKESEAGGHIEIDDTIVVDSTFFYVQSDGSGKPIISLHSSPTAGAGGSGETNTASNLGGDEGIFASKVGVDLQFKGLTAGTNVTLSSDGTSITINSTASGSGGDPGFYGVIFKESEAGGKLERDDTLVVDSDFFYISTQTSGKPLLSLVGVPSAFSVHKDGNNQAATGSDATVTWEAKQFDVGGDFDLANNQFVAPSDGLYSFHAHISTTASSVAADNMAIRVNVNGVTVANGRYTPHSAGDIVNIEINRIIRLASGDTVTIINNFNSSVVITGNEINTWFSGHKLVGTG